MRFAIFHHLISTKKTTNWWIAASQHKPSLTKTVRQIIRLILDKSSSSLEWKCKCIWNWVNSDPFTSPLCKCSTDNHKKCSKLVQIDQEWLKGCLTGMPDSKCLLTRQQLRGCEMCEDCAPSGGMLRSEMSRENMIIKPNFYVWNYTFNKGRVRWRLTHHKCWHWKIQSKSPWMFKQMRWPRGGWGGQSTLLSF